MAKLVPFILVGVGGALVAGFVTALIFAVSSLNPNPKIPNPGVYDAESNRSKVTAEAAGGSFTWHFGDERYDLYSITDIDLGPPDDSNKVLQITGDNYITVETVTADNISCPRLILSDSEIGELVVTNNESDGQSFGAVGGSPANISLESQRGSKNLTSWNSTYDKIILTADQGSPVIDRLVISDIRAFGGSCEIGKLHAGKMTINGSRIGTGDGKSNKDLVIADSVIVGSFSESGNDDDQLVDIR